ncbi:hypothetical protein [Halomonas sp. QHL1]|uniref:hypothetical protein n=1 Tax=Halomonas sp. QHL1 TaxID=1123773 RepID=UPI0008FD1B69|nr:hypothetical protein [Halomonas sp. QHL1]OJA04226.1 hypothetical protein QHL1GM_01760 [Halomonas sp. QHL1]
MDGFQKRLKISGIPEHKINQYKKEVNSLHEDLPSILLRTSVEVVYGTDEEVRNRIQHELKEKYKLDWEVSKKTLLPCLRNYVSTVSSQRERTIRKCEFEAEVRNIWPRMSMVCCPQSLQETDIRRTKLVDEVLNSVESGPLEITGISGSGKTTLASEILERIESTNTRTKPIYMAVRSDKDFRDVISGVAFNLRSYGIDDLLPIAVNYRSSDESSLLDSAKFLSSVDIDLLCIIDLVDGQCSNTFSRELAGFIENLSGNKSKFIVMGQSSSFYYLSALQKKKLKLPRTINMAGFSFDDFLELSDKLCPHLNGERTALFEVYNTLTANRSSMLYARLANLVASCSSLEEMQRLAKLPADEILQEADRSKYNLLSDDLKQTTDKLFCFMLPFQVEQASRVFSSDRVREAIIELVKCGLLRKLENNHYEFHETTRKGMESLTPADIKISTHKTLSDYYESIGDTVATVYHLDQSCQHEKAEKLAKEAFLSGKSRTGLEAYVKKHALVSSCEIINLIFETTDVGSSYMLPKMLDGLGNEDAAGLILERLKEDPNVLSSEFQKTWQITEAIQLCDPFKVYELLKIALTQPIYTDKPDALEHVVQGVRNPKKPIISPELKELFKNQNDEVKAKILPLFLLDKRREILSEAFLFLYAYQEPFNTRSNGFQSSAIRNLNIDDLADLKEFLAAIPIPNDINKMFMNRSPSLGFLENYIWNCRHSIRPLCVEFAQSDSDDENALINALRVLLFLQDENSLLFLNKTLSGKSRLNSLVHIIPSMYSDGINLSECQEKILSTNIDLKERFSYFSFFYQAGGNIENIYDQLIKLDADNSEAWKFLILMASMMMPSKTAIQIFEEKLEGNSSALFSRTLVSLVSKLGELPGVEVDNFLIRILDAEEDVAGAACLSLQTRRLKRALPALLKICLESAGSPLGKRALVAAIASYPSDIAEFEEIWPVYPDMEIWRCILIARLRSLSEADWLVKIATDTSKHWQVRRAAILASGNLPFEAALEKIYGLVLEEKSSLLIDNHPSLLMHNVLAPIILEERQGLLRFFLQGRDCFAEFWGDIFQHQAGGSLFPVEGDAGVGSALWLYERLEYHGWPNNSNAQDNILNELHTPILQAAVLRGLRLSGHADLIENLLPSTESEWLLMRALCELGKVSDKKQGDIDRYSEFVSKGMLKYSVSANNCLKNMGVRRSRVTKDNEGFHSVKNNLEVLNYDQILSQISSEKPIDITSVKIGDLSLDEFSNLVSELDPKNDYETNLTTTTPQLRLVDSGPTIQSSKHSSVYKNRNVREVLRPLLASKNYFDLEIHWHSSLLSGGSGNYRHVSQQYCSAFINALEVHNNSELLYLELEKRSDLILPALGKISYQPHVAKLVDKRIIPYLLAYANSGSDEMLESLCSLAACVSGSRIDSILERLFLRWVNRFEKNTIDLQYYHNISIWRAFNNLKKHPRFIKIPNYEFRLMELLSCNIAWFNRDDIIKAMSESRMSYIRLETILMKSASFEHYGWDEVDRLSDVVESLFSVA